MFQYFLKVVSTQFYTIDGDKVMLEFIRHLLLIYTLAQIKTHQYSATSFERNLAEGSRGSTTEGVHITHSNQGMPGKRLSYFE